MMIAIFNKLKHSWLFIAFIIFFCVIHYLIFFKDGTFVLGGEGHYWLDLSFHVKNQGYTWLNMGTGESTMSVNGFFSYPFLFSYIKNIPLLSYIISVSIYMLPFFSMYLLLSYLYKNKYIHSALFAFFYIANPFSIMYLVAINPWNMHILMTYPLFLYIFLRWYDRLPPLFFILGVTSSLLSYTLTNPPQMALFIVMVPFMMLIASIMHNNSLKLFSYLKNVTVAGISFLLFNIWWIFHWIIVLPQAQKIYTLKFAKAWLQNQAEVSPMILKDIFSFMWIMPRSADFSTLANYFNQPGIQVLMYIPFLLIFIWIVTEMKNSPRRKIIAVLFLGLFILGLFLKGINPPFANLISACFDYVRYCYIFKTAPEKFGVVFVFLTTIIIFFVVTDSKKIWFRLAAYLYLLLLFVPFIGNFYLPDIQIDKNQYTTRKYTDYPEFQNFRNTMVQKKLDFRLLSLPNSGNYQVKMRLNDDKFYTGHNPLMMNIPQSYIADHTNDAYIPLFKNLDFKTESKLLGLFSIRYISFNNRLEVWFGNFTGKTHPEIESILKKYYKRAWHDGQITLYENTDFIPHFWVPDSIIPADESTTVEDMANILEEFQPKMNVAFIPHDITVDANKPTIEFKQIDATKYRVIAHNVSSAFPLIFNESYYPAWKLYLKKLTTPQNNNNFSLEKYFILDGNSADQASRDEVKDYIANGYISTFENTNYISKKIAGTIQNDNLPTIKIFETDDKNQYLEFPDSSHIIANVYANAWIIDPALCDNGFCRKNINGTYDMEMVVEYSQQKILYKSIIVSIGIFIISSIGITAWLFLRLKKKNKHE